MFYRNLPLCPPSEAGGGGGASLREVPWNVGMGIGTLLTVMVSLDLLDFSVLQSTEYLLSGVAFQSFLDSGMSTAGPPFTGPSMQSGPRFADRGLLLKCKSDPELKGWLLQRFPRPQVQGPSPASSQALENLSSSLTPRWLYRSKSGFPSGLRCYHHGEHDALSTCRQFFPSPCSQKPLLPRLDLSSLAVPLPVPSVPPPPAWWGCTAY